MVHRLALHVSQLFTEAVLSAPSGQLTLRNRTVLAPMCMYSVDAHDGVPTPWHHVHLGARAAGGFGLVIAEATAVVPEGRISPLDVGLWNEAQVEAWKPVTAFIKSQGAAAGVQLAHAGAKASTYGWLARFVAQGLTGSIPVDDGGWQTVAPSVTDAHGLAEPREMTVEEIAESVEAWAAATRRADEAGFDLVQIHAAHGYLIHQFLSPLTNTRTDSYGGSFEGRTRYLREVVQAVRAAWPAEKPLGVRFSGSDWVEGGWTIEETSRLAVELRALGVSVFDLSSGGIGAYLGPTGPGYQIALASSVREALQADAIERGVAYDSFVSSVGMITTAEQAEQILVGGQADGVSVARAALKEPNWPALAARDLGEPLEKTPFAPQYWRAAW
ncbi:NADH:flavin oxidoreductase/NADH oxidase [Psychromicrobium xiongbiense]|uniref:NADH:flavin oxidoreductase/NADH oxidase n=1 Tax=Psychromicrobium xiongbiense TaxID=3051184 RepID=UPI0025546100|nr:NADH:flavin oxidoreductase/NADH oxidase [Psychromicrobium sp. YIM S02556]